MKMPVLLSLLLSAACLFAQNVPQPSSIRSVMTNPRNRQMLVSLARAMEVKPMAQPPKWLPGGDEKPLMTIAWLSDLHIGATKGAQERAACALNLLRDEIKPDMTFLTGDLNSKTDNLPPEWEKLPVAEKRWRWTKQFLDRELARPYTPLPGDNWPWDFEKVFGAPTRSCDINGFHFVFTATDAKSPSKDTCAVFLDDTKKWLEEDLASSSGKPTFFVMHETAFPPVFLDAPWVSRTLSRHPNVVAAMGGHLHLDLEFRQGTWKQLVCPAIGPGSRPAFKLMKFYPRQVVMLTYEFANGKFTQVSKYQRIVIPKKLQPAAVPGIVNNRTMAARPKKSDANLAKRSPEVEQALMQAAGKMGLMQFLAP